MGIFTDQMIGRQTSASKEHGMSGRVEQWFSDLNLHQNHLEGSLKYGTGLTSRVFDSVLGVAQEFAFLTRSQVVLMLWVRDHTLRPTGRDEPQVTLAPG